MSWVVWQLVDSAFPAGGFAHSQGLEAAWQIGEVDGASIRQFLADALLQAGYGSLPFVTDAHRRACDLATLDERCDLFVRHPIANRASRTQGQAWLSTFSRVFPAEAEAAVGAERGAVPFVHLAPVFGATVRATGVGLAATQRMHLYSVARGVLSAAVRLGLLGATAAQRILAESGPLLDSVATRCARLGVDDAATAAPLLDLWGALHDRLYSRLFMS